MKIIKVLILVPVMLFCFSFNAYAESVGIVKTLSGSATIQRGGEILGAKLGDELFTQDTIKTSSESALGILLHDDARISVGPDSVMSLDQFSFDQATHEGSADVSIKHGTLSVIAGKMTEKKAGALKVKTPAAILAVRGTEFSVKVEPQQ